MNQVQKFLADRKAMASTNYANASGSSLANLPSNAQSRFGFANGNTQMGVRQYLIQIENLTTSAVSAVDILGAATYAQGGYGGKTWTSAGSLTWSTGVTISAVSTATTYQQILSSLINNPVAVGGVYLQVITGNNLQVSNPYSVTSSSPAGELYTAEKFPIIPPGQFQTGLTYNNDAFNVDSLTKITFPTVYASTTFQIRLYIATDVNPAKAVAGQSVANNYQAPSNLLGQGGY